MIPETFYHCYYCGIHFTARDEAAEKEAKEALGIDFEPPVSICGVEACKDSRLPTTVKTYRKKPVEVTVEGPLTSRRVIITLEGTMVANVGDYVITGIKGEKYPCHPEIFEETYEDV